MSSENIRIEAGRVVGEVVVDLRDIKPEWVETRLRRHIELFPGAVEGVRIAESFDSCSARNTRLDVDFSPEAAGKTSRHLMLRHSAERGVLDEREVRFYGELAPQLPQTPTVPCYDVA